MNIRRTWIVVGAAAAMAGFAGTGIALASDDVELRDQKPAPVVELRSDDAPRQAVGTDSAASPNGVSDSAASAGSADSPAEPRHQAPAKPRPAPAQAAASADSPAPAKVHVPAPAADSAASGDSAGSAGSADSADSAD